MESMEIIAATMPGFAADKHVFGRSAAFVRLLRKLYERAREAGKS